MSRALTHARKGIAAAVAAVLALGAVVLVPTAAQAAPGDASATGVSINLNAGVQLGLVTLPLVNVTGVVGSAVAPAGGGTSTSGLLGVGLGGLGVSSTGSVTDVRATRAPGASQASAQIAGVDINVLGISAVRTGAVQASAVCSAGASGVASAQVADLALLGQAVTLTAAAPTVTTSAGVSVAGLQGAVLEATATRVEQSTASTASAGAVRVALRLSALGIAAVNLGSIELASAQCQAPTASASAASPTSGPTSGGTTLTVTGQGLQNTTGVTVGGVAATSFTAAADGTSLTAVTPASETAGAAAVVVQRPTGNLTAGSFTYVAPTITAVDPPQGTTAGNTLLTITGTGLAGATGVTFGGTAGTLVGTPTATSLQVRTPARAAGAVPVVVVLPGADASASNAYTFVTPTSPIISTLTPVQGPAAGGTTVSITGSNLGNVSSVTFGGAAATIIGSPSATSITVRTPARPVGPAAVVVTNPGGATTAAQTFTYVEDGSGATFTGITPPQVPTAGGTFTISGTGLSGATGVRVGGVAATNVTVTGTSITATAPATETAGSATVVVDFPAAARTAGTVTRVAPTITAVSPVRGPIRGGTTVTVTGTGLAPTTGVTFGGTAATVTSVAPDGTSLTATAPAHPAGPVAVTAVLLGADATLNAAFTYLDDGTTTTVTGVQPVTLPTSGGTTLTITGSGLGNVTAVTVGGVTATELTVAPGGTSLTVVAPASQDAGPAPVVLRFPLGDVAAGDVTYVGPTITSIDPSQGPTAGGTLVTLTGTGLSAATRVLLDGTPATALSVDGDVLTFRTPAHAAGAVDVVVVLPGADATAANGYAYRVPAAAAITGVTPDEGPTSGGTTVTLTGSGLGTVSQVQFGGVPVTSITPVDAGTVRVVAPPHPPGPVTITVVNAGGTSLLPGGYEYLADGTGASVTGVFPESVATSGGATLVLVGEGLTGASGLTVGGTAATDVVVQPDGTLLTATVPPSATAGPAELVLQFPLGTAPAGQVTYVGPTIEAIAPPEGPTSGGTEVRLTGTGLEAATAVTFDGTPGTDVELVEPGVLRVTAPAHGAGDVQVAVLVPGLDPTPVTYTYLLDGADADVTGVSPATLPTSGGTVTVSGTDLGGAVDVLLGGRSAPGVTVTGTAITFTAPPVEAAGQASVVLVYPGGRVDAGLVRYVAPTLTAASPTSGPTSGGTPATLTGTGLSSATQVRFGDTVVPVVSAAADGTSVQVVTPARGPGAVDVTVVLAGRDASAETLFTYLEDGAGARVTSVEPASVATSGGTTVTLRGTGLSDVTGVVVGGVGATDVTTTPDGSTVTFVVPASEVAGAASIALRFPAGIVPGGQVVYVAPTLTSLDPAQGAVSGGTKVVLRGTGLAAATGVQLGGSPAQVLAVAPDGTSVTVRTPAHAAGVVAATVTLPGADATRASAFTYLRDGASAQVTGLDPATVPTAGGVTVTLTGSGFTGVTGVTVRGTAATGLVVVDDGTLRFTVPATGTAGAAPVVLQFPAGTAAAGNLTYVASTVTSVVPAQGGQAGGTAVTVTGTRLGAVTEVLVGGAAATGVSATATSVTFTTPAGTPGAADVVLVQPGADVTVAGGFTYLVDGSQARVTALSPARVPTSGGTVTITGTGLQGATSVSVGAATGTGLTVAPDGTSATFTVPPSESAGSAPVVLRYPGGSSAAGTLTLVAPVVTTIDPDEGPVRGGTSVTLTGTGLAGATAVTFDGQPGLGLAAGPNGSLTVTTPPGEEGTTDVVVVLPGLDATAADAFTYLDDGSGIVVDVIDPVDVPVAGGTQVTVTGEGLTNVTAATVGGTPAQVGDVTATELTLTVPPSETTGPAAVVLEVGDLGTAAAGEVTYVPSVADDVDPASGPQSGGTGVTVTGERLGAVTDVLVGGAAATDVVATAGAVTFTTSAGAPGTVDVVLVQPGLDVTVPDGFTYLDDGSGVTVTGVDPRTGPLGGGTRVEVTGTGLAPVTGVTVGGVAATDVDVAGDGTSVAFTVPAGAAAGPAPVVLVLPGGTLGVGTFVYVDDGSLTQVTTLDPPTSPTAGGGTLTITGTNLSGVVGVTVGGVPAANLVVAPTQVTVTVPPADAAGAVPVVLEFRLGDGVAAGDLTYVASTVTDVDPAVGPQAGGTGVTVTGTGLGAVTEVLVDGVPARDVVATATQVSFTTPTGTPGAVDVVLVQPGADVTLTGGFTYRADGSVASVAVVDPPSGPLGGGTVVVLEGAGMTGATGVRVGTTDVTTVDVAPDGTTLTFTTPPGTAAGDVALTVLFPAGTTPGGTFTYVDDGSLTQVDALDPTTSPTAGGGTVTVTGTGLSGVTGVRVGTATVPATVVDDGTLTFAVPPAAAPGPVAVVLLLPAGDGVPAGTLTYVASTVADVAPPQGPQAGGTDVTVTGTDLGAVTQVLVGGTPATGVAATATTVTFTTPPGTPGAVDVVLVQPGADVTLTGGFTYLVDGTDASVDALVPVSGPLGGGTRVTVAGSDLGGATGVRVGATDATDVEVAPDGTGIAFTTPPGTVAGPLPVVLVYPGGTLGAGTFTYVDDGSRASVAQLDPTTSPTAGGVTVTVTGTGLGTVTGVEVDGVLVPVTVVDGTTLTFVAPPTETPGAADVVLRFPAGTLAAGTLTYTASTVDDVVPAQGPQSGGTDVTVTGEGLAAVTDVLVGGLPATGVVATAGSVTFTTPPGAPGAVDVVLVQPGADVVVTDGFTYLADGSDVVVDRIDPATLPTSGGTVTVVGTGLTGVTGATVGGVPATDVTVAPDGTSVTLTVAPVAAAGTVPVVLELAGGTAAAGPLTLAAPTLTSVDPAQGTAAGGTLVTIRGTGLAAATDVTFDGVSGLGVLADPDGTSLTVTTPTGTAGAVDVVVVLPGLDASLADGYRYLTDTSGIAVDELTPATAPTSGGVVLTVTGTGFTGVTGATVGGVPAAVRVVSDTELEITVPPSDRVGDVAVVLLIVEDETVAAGELTYVAPVVDVIDPDEGPQAGGTSVTVTGTDLGAVTDVLVGGAPVTDLTVADDELTFDTPPGTPGPADVDLVLPGADVLVTDGFTYLADGTGASVDGLDPTTLPTSGGTVTVTGTGLQPVLGVTVGGVAATDVVVAPDGTSVTFTVPPRATGGTLPVVLEFPAADLPAGDLVVTAPTLTAVDPAQGSESGGTSVTLTGTGLAAATDVTFGGEPGLGLEVAPDGTSLTVTTPPGAPGPVDVVVVLPGADATLADGFTYVEDATPVEVDGLDPTTVPTAGGTVVTVEGSGFTAVTGATVDGEPVAVTVLSDTVLTFVAPPAAAAGPAVVVLTTADGTVLAGELTYVAPTVTQVEPADGPERGGTSVTLTGTRLAAVTEVLVGGTPATALVVGANRITFTTPAGAVGPADVVLVQPGADVTLTDAFEYLADGSQARVDEIVPDELPTAGGEVTVRGAGLARVTGVRVGGVTALDVRVAPDGTSVTFRVAPRQTAGRLPVVLLFDGGALTAGEATLVAPTVTGVDPAQGSEGGGTVVTVTGTGFTGATDVLFGVVAGLAPVVADDGTSVTVTTPPGTPGPVDVTVVVPGADGTAADTFTYVEDASGVTVDDLAPATSPTSGGTTVTVTGTGLTAVTGATVGGTAVAVTVVSDTELTFTTPPSETTGTVPVVLQVPDGTVAAGTLTYEAPSVAAVLPAQGPSTGGTRVTVSGTGLGAVTQVLVGGVPATRVLAAGGTLGFTTPPGAAGTVDVVLVQPGADVTLDAAFTYVDAGPGTTVTGLEPTSLPTSGGTVTVTGTGLDDVTGVTVGGRDATDLVVADDGTSLTFTAPATSAAGPVAVVLQVGGATAAAGELTYVAPTLTAVDPAQGPAGGGTEVTLTGTGLAAATSVTFGGVAGLGLVVAPDGTSLTVTTPAGTPGPGDVVVVLPGADATAAGGFTYLPDWSGATVTGLDPATSPTSGGVTVSVRGAGLDVVTGVRVGGVPATDVVATGSVVSFTVPPSETAGPAAVVLEGAGGTLAGGELTYVAATVTGVDPAQGPQAGGTPVRVTGTGLGAVTQVLVGGVDATDLTVADDEVTFTTPAGATGAVDVVLVQPGADVVLADGFTYLADGSDASADGLDPTTLPTSGGQVTVTGTGLLGVTGVTVGGVTATDVVVAPDGTSVTFTVPPAATSGTVPVVLAFDGATVPAGDLTLVAPTVAEVAPATGSAGGGTAVTVTGTGLAAATAVTFGGEPGLGLVVAPDGTSLTVTTPPGTAGVVDVVVVLPGADATAADGFTYVEDPAEATVTGVDPTTSPTAGGVTVTVTGTGLDAVTGVTVGGAAATDVAVGAGGTSLTFTVPAAEAAGTVPVVLQLDDGTLLAGALTYVASTTTGLAPDAGPQDGGTRVTVTGTRLDAVTEVLVGGAAATDVVASATQVAFTTPPGTPGPVDVVLVQPGADVTVADGFTYLADGTGAVVDGLEPSSVPTSGGTVTVVGTGLQGATGVTIGGVPATDVVVADDGTSVTFTVPPRDAAGSAPVVVRYPGGDVPAGDLDVVGPGVTDVEPAQGPAAGGTPVTVTGSGLAAATAVTFDGRPGTDLDVAPDGTSLTVTSPAGTPGAADLVVVLPGPDATATFTYLADGTGVDVLDVTPATSPTTGGGTVTVTGTGLSAVTGATVGGVPVAVEVVSDTEVRFVVPATETPGAAAVVLELPAGTVGAGNLLYVAPTVTSLDPDEGPESGGTEVTATGTDLGAVTEVLVGGEPATGLVATPEEVTFTTPPGTPGAVDVVLVQPGVDVTLTDGFTYVPDEVDVVVDGLEPSSLPTSGGTVTVTGSGLAGVTGVTVGGVEATDVVVAPDGTSVTFTVPPSATAGPVAVVLVLPDGTAAAGELTLVAPTVTGLDPAQGTEAGGTLVTVTGTGLAAATSVTFGGEAGLGLVAAPDGTSLTVTTPPGTVGPVDVVVALPGLDATLAEGFTYTEDASGVEVEGLSPTAVPTAGGVTVTVTGSGLSAVTGATVGGVEVPVEVVSDTELRFVAPTTETPVSVPVVLSTPGGTVLAGELTYTASTVTALDPDEGPQAGGTDVTASGTDLGAVTEVLVDGAPATDVVATDDEVTFTTPPGTPGPVDVVLVQPGADVTVTDGFTYVADGSGVVVEGLEPTSLPTSGGTVTLTGTGLGDVTGVTVGGVPATGVVVSPDGTSVTFTVPPSQVPGPVAVVLELPAGTAAAGDVTLVAPTVTGLDPAEGSAAGGTVVTVTGTGLAAATSVRFDGVAGLGLVAADDGTSLTVTTPPGAVGPVTVSVTLPGLDATLVGGFTYVEDASGVTVEGLSPTTVPTAGGATVTVTGSGLSAVTGVTVGGVEVPVEVVSDTELRFVVPASETTGVVPVVLSTPDGPVLAGTVAYAASSVTALDPDEGPESGGTEVTATGTDLGAVTEVLVGGAPATGVVATAESVTFTTPPGTPGAVDVVLVQPGADVTLTDGFTYLADEVEVVVEGLEPASLPTSGGTVTVTGSGFGDVTGVTVGGVAATDVVVSADGTTVTFTVPPSATAGPVAVVLVLPDGTAAAGELTLVAPTVTGLDPAQGSEAGGTSVTVTGTGLAGATGVTFGGEPGLGLVVAPDGTSLTVTTPPGTVGPVDVVVVLPGLDATLAEGFTYLEDASGVDVEGLSPTTSPTAGGGTVTVTGTGLSAVTGVTVGGVEVAVEVVSDTELRFVVPATETPGAVPVVLTVPGGTVLAGELTYTASTVTALDPDEGPQAGGTDVTATGTDLGAVTEVLVDGEPATDVVATDDEVTFTTPPGAPGAVDVVLVQPGADVTLADGFTYLVDGSAAQVTALTPPTVATAGGTVLTITGTGLTGATGVLVDGAPATDVVVAPDGTSITVTVPPRTQPGPVDVVAQFPAGTVDAGQVTYADDGSGADVLGFGPAAGPTSGGGTVTVTGTGLGGATGLTFGGVAATDVVVTDTQVTATLPPSEVGGLVPLVLQFPAGTVDVGEFVYGAPVVDAVTPATGPEDGGTTVTITGSGLAAATGVTFDGVPGTDLDVTGDAVTVVTPPHAQGPVDVVVQLPGLDATAAGGFGYLPPEGPYVEAFLPGRGPTTGGTVVDIRGLGLETTTRVTFDGIPAEIVGGPAPLAGEVTTFADEPTPTEVSVVTPPHPAGWVDVVVTTAAGDTLIADGFEYYLADDAQQARILWISPTVGPTSGGQTVAVHGSGFVPGATTVTIGEILVGDVTVLTDELLVLVTPEGPEGVWPLRVWVDGTPSEPLTYEYVADAPAPPAAPTVTRVTPATVPTTGGTTVTVEGTGFVPGATTVLVCDVVRGLDEVTVAADGRSLQVVVPPCAAGPATLTVVTPGGTLAVTITYVAPEDGPGTGGPGTPGPGTGGSGGSGGGSGGQGGWLPWTGADAGAAWWAALALLVGGALLWVARIGRSGRPGHGPGGRPGGPAAGEDPRG